MKRIGLFTVKWKWLWKLWEDTRSWVYLQEISLETNFRICIWIHRSKISAFYADYLEAPWYIPRSWSGGKIWDRIIITGKKPYLADEQLVIEWKQGKIRVKDLANVWRNQVIHSDSDTLKVNIDTVENWISKADKCMEMIGTLIHLRSGKPSRATELSEMTFVNSVLSYLLRQIQDFIWRL